MHRLVVAALLIGFLIAVDPPRALAQAPVQSGRIVFSTQADWQRGTRTDVQIIANADGELRLTASATRGTFVSEPISLTMTLHAVGAMARRLPKRRVQRKESEGCRVNFQHELHIEHGSYSSSHKG